MTAAAIRVWRRSRVRQCVAGRVAIFGALFALSSACSTSDRKAGDTMMVAADTTAASADSTTAAADTGCVEAGAWSECNLTKRLESSGLAPRRSQGAIRQPFLSVPGVVFNVGNAELQTYLYADTLALQRDFAQLDTVRVAPPTMQISWRSTPNLIRSNNLLAILLSNDETQVERVRNAITAGLPALKAAP